MEVQTVQHNCARCGKDFDGGVRQILCAVCRRPEKPEEGTLAGVALSFREKQVVERVVQGKLNKEIAWELKLAEGTIKEYMNRIFRKVGVRNRVELGLWGFKQALLEGDAGC